MTGPRSEFGSADERDRRSDEPGHPPAEPGHPPAEPAARADEPRRDAHPPQHPDVNADGNRPTEVLPRRRPPLSEQPTTALPRPPAGYRPPVAEPYRPPAAHPYRPLNAEPYVPPRADSYRPPRPDAYRPPSPEPYHPPTPGQYRQPPPDRYRPPEYPRPSEQPYRPPPDQPYGAPAVNGGSTAYGPPATYSAPAAYGAAAGNAAPSDHAAPAVDGDPGRTGYPDQRDQRPQSPLSRGTHLPPYSEPLAGTPAAPAGDEPATAGHGVRTPRKITVTRVAAMRSRELTLRGVEMFHRATTADGADRSGLAHLTYAQMANYACDAALAVALANTLFLVKPEEGPGRVLLYLLITVAPFAFVAPLIGPFLDRLQTGRRLALALSMGGRGLLAIPMIFTFSGADASWALYPCALGSLVLSKSFGVLKASLTPRVLPEEITLVATNSRLTVFGLIAGGVAGAIAGGLTWLFGSPGALVFTALLGFGGAYLCLKIPAWVESTEGEVPVHLSPLPTRNAPAQLTIAVRATLWANSSIRIETGFLAMFIAFVVMKEYAAESGFYKLMLLGLVGGAAGVGGFLGNALGAKLPLRSPESISLISLIATVATTLCAAVFPGLAMAAIVGFVGSTASSLAKVCLDSVIQRDLPEVSRASAFGRSETALQLGWVFGGVIGLLIGGLLNLSHNPVYTIGFAVATALLALGAVQTWLSRTGRSLIPPITMPWQRGARTRTRRPRAQREADGTYTTRISFTEDTGAPPTPLTTTRPDQTAQMPASDFGGRRRRRRDTDPGASPGPLIRRRKQP